MIKFESLSSYVGKVSEEEYFNLATRIYMITDFICTDYPKHKNWYFTKQLPGIIDESREIVFARSDYEIVGMACLKKDGKEKKLCTLYVKDNFRNQRIGSKIVSKSLKWLETNTPLLSVKLSKLDGLRPFIDKYNWELSKVEDDELYFNGDLLDIVETRNKLNRRLIKTINHSINKKV